MNDTTLDQVSFNQEPQMNRHERKKEKTIVGNPIPLLCYIYRFLF